jgi:hypothetical protein
MGLKVSAFRLNCENRCGYRAILLLLLRKPYWQPTFTDVRCSRQWEEGGTGFYRFLCLERP